MNKLPQRVLVLEPPSLDEGAWCEYDIGVLLRRHVGPVSARVRDNLAVHGEVFDVVS